MSDCIFCGIVSGNVPAKILGETEHSISFLDAFPLAKGHVLVIPKAHRQKIQNLEKAENADLFSLVHSILPKIDSMTGSTLVAVHNGEDAGQEVPHVHVHLIPRSADDSAGPVHSMFESNLMLSESELNDMFERLKI